MIEKQQGEPALVMQQIGMLNLRINDFIRELNATLKALMDENAALREELKGKLEKGKK